MPPDNNGSSAASNPKDPLHLPVAGEFDSMNIPNEDTNPLVTASDDSLDVDSDTDPATMNHQDATSLSAHNTDQTNADQAAAPEGPVNPTGTMAG